jgi:hypothetical protein
MKIEPPVESLMCSQCSRNMVGDTTSRGNGLRRGLCRACYLRAWRGTQLPDDASCRLCDERRASVLRWTKVGVGREVTCQNCGFLADRLRPKAQTLDELKLQLDRERRQAGDRRHNYIIDPEDPSERRAGPRRRARREVAS